MPTIEPRVERVIEHLERHELEELVPSSTKKQPLRQIRRRLRIEVAGNPLIVEAILDYRRP